MDESGSRFRRLPFAADRLVASDAYRSRATPIRLRSVATCRYAGDDQTSVIAGRGRGVNCQLTRGPISWTGGRPAATADRENAFRPLCLRWARRADRHGSRRKAAPPSQCGRRIRDGARPARFDAEREMIAAAWTAYQHKWLVRRRRQIRSCHGRFVNGFAVPRPARRTPAARCAWRHLFETDSFAILGLPVPRLHLPWD